MAKSKRSARELTDVEVLEEFVRRFECDGAVLVYAESDTEFGFGRWANSRGQKWVENIFTRIKQTVILSTESHAVDGGKVVCLSE